MVLIGEFIMALSRTQIEGALKLFARGYIASTEESERRELCRDFIDTFKLDIADIKEKMKSSLIRHNVSQRLLDEYDAVINYTKSVSVSYIQRERNTEADKLGRDKMYLCLATDVYNSIVSKCDSYDNLKHKYELEVIERKRIEDEIEQIKKEKQNTLWNRFIKWINKKCSILSFE